MAWRWQRSAILALLLVGASFPSGGFAEEDESITTDEILTEEEVEVIYATPKYIEGVHLMETFDDVIAFDKNWVISKAKKEGVDEDIAKYDGKWAVEPAEKMPLVGDQGLVLKSKAKHAAISVALKKPFVFEKKPLVVQYEVNLQNGQECGGAYIKLLSKQDGRDKLKNFNDKTPYTIMFGPDKCGNEFKLHFIFRHINPLTGEVEEKHAKRPRDKIEEPFKDKKPHLYTLVVHPDNTFEILLDHEIINSGSLLEDFSPPVNPAKEIADPNDTMPEDWDEREKIPDPDATKPDDWDEDAPFRISDPDAVEPTGWLKEEPEMVPDPSSEKPEDWDEEMDGEWEAALINNPKCTDAPGCGEWKAPVIDNPNYKGKWRPSMIDNPNYRGKWTPRKIANPDYFEDLEPFKMTSIEAVGIELWSMSENILFDNIMVTDSIQDAEQFAGETYDLKVMKLERGQVGVFRRIINYSNKNPWLYGIYVLLIAIPVVLIFVCCCGEVKDNKDKDAEHKKTDEPTEDDVHTEDDATEKPVEETKDTGETTTTTTTTTTAAAATSEEPAGNVESDGGEEKDEEEEEEEEEKEEEEAAAGEEKAEKSDEGEQELQTRTSPRLRKSRRE